MSPLFKKLQVGRATSIHVLNAPASFEPELQTLQGIDIHREASGPVAFAMAFVTTLQQVAEATAALTDRAEGDAAIWMVYPKRTSKRYACEFHRDNGWAALGAAGYEPVSMVAVDEDWSALRFRKAEFIKVMKRPPEGAISSTGREKAGLQKPASSL